ncbi:WD40/YVTN/BNR-like repeat-containing protein [Pseudoduganella sp. UC29_106]|uniref:WD40/YVTN/BNR-like repeat-containing protein n=1 Tax=Pseudoduganella sp. UC29_106 TaxID=3374553 RepID=UPI003756A82A
MSAGPGDASRLYRTKDGGATWQLLITNPDKDGFWDAIAFWDARNGILFGDPVNGAFRIFTTSDGGDSWQPASDPHGLAALKSEGAFAASGTCLSVSGSSDAWFATGGAQTARVFHSADRGRTWRAAPLPIPAGAASKGIFSVGFRDGRTGIAVGGDYKEPALSTLNGARSDDGGATWTAASVLPAGYMSAVAPVPGAPQAFVAGGLAGSGISRDAGKTWVWLDGTPVNAVAFASPGAGWAVGPKGW